MYLRTLVLSLVPLLAIAAPIFVEPEESSSAATAVVEPASYLLFESLCEYYENVSDEVLESSTLDMLFEDGLYDALKTDLGPLDGKYHIRIWALRCARSIRCSAQPHFCIAY